MWPLPCLYWYPSIFQPSRYSSQLHIPGWLLIFNKPISDVSCNHVFKTIGTNIRYLITAKQETQIWSSLMRFACGLSRLSTPSGDKFKMRCQILFKGPLPMDYLVLFILMVKLTHSRHSFRKFSILDTIHTLTHYRSLFVPESATNIRLSNHRQAIFVYLYVCA